MRGCVCVCCGERRASTQRHQARGCAAPPAPAAGRAPGTRVPSAMCPSTRRSRGPGAERDSPSPGAPVRRPRTQLGLYLRQRRRPDAPARQRPQRWPREGPGVPRPPRPGPIPVPAPELRAPVPRGAEPRHGRDLTGSPCRAPPRPGSRHPPAAAAHQRVCGRRRCGCGRWTLPRPARGVSWCRGARRCPRLRRERCRCPPAGLEVPGTALSRVAPLLPWGLELRGLPASLPSLLPLLPPLFSARFPGRRRPGGSASLFPNPAVCLLLPRQGSGAAGCWLFPACVCVICPSKGGGTFKCSGLVFVALVFVVRNLLVTLMFPEGSSRRTIVSFHAVVLLSS